MSEWRFVKVTGETGNSVMTVTWRPVRGLPGVADVIILQESGKGPTAHQDRIDIRLSRKTLHRIVDEIFDVDGEVRG